MKRKVTYNDDDGNEGGGSDESGNGDSNDENTSSYGGLSTGTIIGISVGGGVCLLLVAYIFMKWRSASAPATKNIR
jgi:hypothetical protein